MLLFFVPYNREVPMLKCSIADIEFEHPVMNAAGVCKHLQGETGVEILSSSATAAIMVGSMTVLPRDGNTGNVYYYSGNYSLNSLGLPNPGSTWYSDNLSEMKRLATAAGKSLWLSVAGFNPKEFAALAKIAADAGVDGIELNLGCPNVWDGGTQKRIACFEPLLVETILDLVIQYIGSDIAVIVKVSPYSDPVLLGEVAGVLSESRLVKGVTTMNTFPNGFATISRNRPAISVGNGYAGLAGPAVKAIGLGQVMQFRERLPSSIAVIGVGGIRTGKDVQDYLDAGATMVQVATALLERGPNIFSQVLAELIDIQDTHPPTGEK